MKSLIKSIFIITIIQFSSFNTIKAQQLSAKEIVRKAYDLSQGESNESTIKMDIVRPTWTRSISVKTWTKGYDYSLALVTDPAKEKGMTFLKRKNEMWNWVPNIGRMIKLPPSMMSQGWMGSDYSNDDMLKESSIVNDYEHTLITTEKYNNNECYKIKLTPKPDAPVVWGYIVKWISKDGYFQLKSEYYDEENILIKTETASEIKVMDDRKLPTRFEIIPADNPDSKFSKLGYKTIVSIVNAKFSVTLNDNFFSQQNMKNVK